MLSFWCCDMESPQQLEVEPMPGSTACCPVCGEHWIITHTSAGREVFGTGCIYLGCDLYGRRFRFLGVPSTDLTYELR